MELQEIQDEFRVWSVKMMMFQKKMTWLYLNKYGLLYMNKLEQAHEKDNTKISLLSLSEKNIRHGLIFGKM